MFEGENILGGEKKKEKKKKKKFEKKKEKKKKKEYSKKKNRACFSSGVVHFSSRTRRVLKPTNHFNWQMVKFLFICCDV